MVWEGWHREVSPYPDQAARVSRSIRHPNCLAGEHSASAASSHAFSHSLGHEEQFPPRRLNGRYGLRKRYFAGLDVSLEETALCVVDETGRVIKEVRAASEPGPLPAALQGTGLLLERIGLKACSLTAWLPIFRHPPKASEISPIGKALVLSEGAFPPRRPTLG